jgi:hypothetical protein
MLHRFLFLLTMLIGMTMRNAHAEMIKAPSIEDRNKHGTAAQQLYSGSIRVDLRLQQKDQRLYAYVVVFQPRSNAHNSSKIRIDWIPPLHSSCDKSSYFLSYQGEKFHTQAYRTLGYRLINGKAVTCTGTWEADVRDAQGRKLTTAVIHIGSADSYANAKMQSLAEIA